MVSTRASRSFSLGSNPSGSTNIVSMEEKEEFIKYLTESFVQCLAMAETLDQLVRENNLQNEQWFIDWQDKLNEISVR